MSDRDLIAEADDLRGMPDGAIQALVGDLRVALMAAVVRAETAEARIALIAEMEPEVQDSWGSMRFTETQTNQIGEIVRASSGDRETGKRVLLTPPHDGHPDSEVCPECPHAPLGDRENKQ